MTSKAEKDKTKQLQDKCQSVLNALLRDEDNKYCVDCDSKGPRWASWNLGVFLCIRCAGIHRNLGVHISKVKSVNLDSWTPEQVVSLQQMGNSRARAVYEANIPDNFRRPQNDTGLETFIRAKYEHKKYIAREWVQPALPEVNWEKEIDEEIERQKRKKKTVVEKKPLGAMEVPQLPKPKNASPKPGRVQVQETKASTDLLGLQNGDDSFSNFLSAPVSTENQESKVDPIKSEEESFFNQTAPTEKEKAKLTKDSILALYATAPVNPVNNFNPTYPATQQGGFNQGFYQQGFNTGTFPTTFPQRNGMSFSGAQYSGQFPQQFPGNNQFTMPMNNVQPNVQQFPQTNQMNQFGFPQQQHQQQGGFNAFNQQPAFNAQPPNPFFNQSTLPQQFANLALNGQKSNPSTTVPTNIWQ